MAKRRWDRRKRIMRLAKPRVASIRSERIDVVRDPETKLLLKVGPDHGTKERETKDGGIIIGERLLGLAQTAWVVAPGAMEMLRYEGGLDLGIEAHAQRAQIVRRWMEAAETLRALATRAGCQRRLTGRYDFGAIGRGEMSDKAVDAFNRMTRLAERLSWARLSPLLDLVLYDTLPPGLRRPAWPDLPMEGQPEYPAYQRALRHNPAIAEALQRAVREAQDLHRARVASWERACREVQVLLDWLALAFGLKGPIRPQ